MAAEEKNKVQEIVDLLKKDGVDAGKSEAERIISSAKSQADEIINKANEQKDSIVSQARDEAEKLKSSAEANVRMAVSQGLNKFKESVEKSLLSDTVMESLNKVSSGDTIKDIVITVVKSYSDQGFSSNDLSVILPKDDKEKVKSAIMSEISQKVKNSQGIDISDDVIPKGVKLNQKDGNLSLEFTPESLQEVMLNYIRPEFRKMFFDKK